MMDFYGCYGCYSFDTQISLITSEYFKIVDVCDEGDDTVYDSASKYFTFAVIV